MRFGPNSCRLGLKDFDLLDVKKWRVILRNGVSLKHVMPAKHHHYHHHHFNVYFLPRLWYGRLLPNSIR